MNAETLQTLVEKIRDELTVLMASATPILAEDDLIAGYQIKTGSLHRILGHLAGAGLPCTIPSGAPSLRLGSAVPPGWKVEPHNYMCFRGYFVQSPSGKSAIVHSHEKNPEIVLYELAHALATGADHNESHPESPSQLA